MHDSGPSAVLVELAQAYGVGTEYWDWQGNRVCVSVATLQAVLTALGVSAATDAQARESLQLAHDRRWRQMVPPTVVVTVGKPTLVPVHVVHGTPVALTIWLEDGSAQDVRQVEHQVEPREVGGELVGEALFELGAELPLGWHTLIAEGAEGARSQATVIVTPARLELPMVLREGRVWGLMAQLYQARSTQSWGIGDLADLATMASWAGQDLGAEFVLVNPLHAAQPTAPMEPSPYLPTTRRFANPLYLRVEHLPGFGTLSRIERRTISALADTAKVLNSADTIDRDTAWALKRQALWRLFRAAPDQAGVTEFKDAEGDGLTGFATWCAIAEKYGGTQDWPAALAAAEPTVVAHFASVHEVEIEFHCWLQWQLAQQLAQVQTQARAAGMSLGVVHDLAVGVHPEGADSWSLRAALASGVSVGAPPDQYNQLGQDWSQPPWHPQRLAELGYAPFRDMVRGILRDAGGIRVDHVIGLFRLWWVPDGATADAGAYVEYDYEALIGILVLEAHRAGAVVIGEDLGVVPAHARDYLRDRGILGTSIVWFERTAQQLLPAENYRELCLASVTTHDLPPTAGYLELAHVALRDKLGLLTRPLEEETAQELATLAMVGEELVERGLLSPESDQEAMVVALHRYLGQTPSKMLGVALADLVGDRRIVNQPGTCDEYPNWRVPLGGPDGRPILLEDVMEAALPRRIAARMLHEG
ncbi:MAG: 4-alpha-glucanotransferase [Nocardioides sp.]